MKKVLIYGSIGFVVLFILAAFAFAIFQPIKVLPRIRLSPGFALQDQAGQRLTNEDLRGRIVLFGFSYTGCTSCEHIEKTMAEVQARLGEINLAGVPVNLVTISIDPQHDRVEKLKAYADHLGAQPDVWRIVTTPDEARLKTIVGSGFRVYYAPREDGSIQLDPVFILVDGWGIIRGDYRFPTAEPDTERILRHIGVLAEEVHKSVGAARLAYEAAHLFMCYAP
jgi:protein SCO1/2